jgi:hypothetical protein
VHLSGPSLGGSIVLIGGLGVGSTVLVGVIGVGSAVGVGVIGLIPPGPTMTLIGSQYSHLFFGSVV